MLSFKQYNFINKLSQELDVEDYDDLFEMANVLPEETGLNMMIWISPRLPGMKHGPRIKVSKRYGNNIDRDLFSIKFDLSGNVEQHKNTGDIKSKDVKEAIEFVKLNLNVLMSLWKGEISPTQAINKFKKI